MIHPIQSFFAHRQNNMAENYEKTKNGRVLSTYKNRHKDARCFFIGNGPSLRADDLTRLFEQGEICFGFNRIYNIFDQTPWRPTYYISQDEKMLQGCMEFVEKEELGNKFIPINLKWYHGIRLSTATWFLMKAPLQENDKPLEFSDDPARVVYNSSTGMYTAAQFAAYMGIKEIYLIGVDHQFHISQNNKGEVIVDESVKDYFSDKYNEDKENLYIPNTEKSTQTYIAMKEQCDKRGIKIYNATRGGKLEVFPRIDLDSVLTKC